MGAVLFLVHVVALIAFWWVLIGSKAHKEEEEEDPSLCLLSCKWPTPPEPETQAAIRAMAESFGVNITEWWDDHYNLSSYYETDIGEGRTFSLLWPGTNSYDWEPFSSRKDRILSDARTRIVELLNA